MLIAKITHCPFGEPFVSEEDCTQVTELSSDGFNYDQFCNLIGQTALHYGFVKIELRYQSKKI